jgi:hypothetical protein
MGAFPVEYNLPQKEYSQTGWRIQGLRNLDLIHQLAVFHCVYSAVHLPFISLFMIIPVSGTSTWLPKNKLIVVITEIARPLWSAVAR